MKNPSIQIRKGQKWIRKYGISRINTPHILEILTLPIQPDYRYEIATREGVLYFERDDIVTKYELRTHNKKFNVNGEIAEIKGWRYSLDEPTSTWLWSDPEGTYVGEGKIPNWSGSLKRAEELLTDIGDLGEVRFRPNMGNFILNLIKYESGVVKQYKSNTKQLVICEAWIDCFG